MSCLLQAEEVKSVHEVRDKNKLAEIKADMAANGWTGRPLLVVNRGGSCFALTGSHRLAAAAELGLSVPVVAVDGKLLDSWGRAHEGQWDILDAVDDNERLKILREVGDVEAIRLMKSEGWE